MLFRSAGRAFVTEFAGPLPESVDLSNPNPAGPSFAPPAPPEALVDYTRLSTDGLAQAKNACDVVKALVQTKFPIDSESATILEKATGIAAFAAGKANLELAAVQKQYLQIEAGLPFACESNPKVVDGPALAAELKSKFAEPILAVMPLVTAQPKFTRMVMKLSPKEMTKDPIFAWNPGLPNVARERKAQVASVCGGDRKSTRLNSSH